MDQLQNGVVYAMHSQDCSSRPLFIAQLTANEVAVQGNLMVALYGMCKAPSCESNHHPCYPYSMRMLH